MATPVMTDALIYEAQLRLCRDADAASDEVLAALQELAVNAAALRLLSNCQADRGKGTDLSSRRSEASFVWHAEFGGASRRRWNCINRLPFKAEKRAEKDRRPWTCLQSGPIGVVRDKRSALRQITAEQLQQLGTDHVVYLRAGFRDGALLFVVYRADGQPVALADTIDTAAEMAIEHGLAFVLVHWAQAWPWLPS
jgi:hypothetical protein